MGKTNFMNLIDCEDNLPLTLELRKKIDVVCVGDSITGYNNWERSSWIETYPEFLAPELDKREKKMVVANCGMAGELSDDGPMRVGRFLKMFPNSNYFVIGYGANDLGDYRSVNTVSKEIIEHLDEMVDMVLERGKKPILLNVPNINSRGLTPLEVYRFNEKRKTHNKNLAEYCVGKKVGLVDICSKLKDEHFVDNLHPNNIGAVIIARAVANSID